MTSKAMVVLSGGLDSTTALALALESGEEVCAITFDYGQRHAGEVDAAIRITETYGIDHLVIEDVPLGKGGVLLTDEEMPHQTYEELHEAEGPSPTYVPYRNGTFLSIAASHALVEECDVLIAGMHAEDAHNWAYPDCTPEFIGAMQNAIYIGTYFKLRLSCPFTYLIKRDIIKIGMLLNAPYHLTMSCYEGRIPACGKCPTCVARQEAFIAAGYIDPLLYEEA